MGRKGCCWRAGLRKGAWTHSEDNILSNYVQTHGPLNWRDLPRKAGLERCGKSCRLRWLNYLKPDIKRGSICPEEEDLIIKLHSLLGNKWSLIAGRLPGRTDNEIKNHWNCKLRKIVTNKDLKVVRDTRVRCTTPVDQNHDDYHKIIRPKAVRCTKVINSPHTPSHYDHRRENQKTTETNELGYTNVNDILNTQNQHNANKNQDDHDLTLMFELDDNYDNLLSNINNGDHQGISQVEGDDNLMPIFNLEHNNYNNLVLSVNDNDYHDTSQNQGSHSSTPSFDLDNEYTDLLFTDHHHLDLWITSLEQNLTLP